FGRPIVTGLAALFLVAARAEGSVAGSGEGDYTDGAVDPCRLEAADKLVDGAAAERVVPLRSVDRDPRQPGVDRVGDVGESVQFHGADSRWNRKGKDPS